MTARMLNRVAHLSSQTVEDEMGDPEVIEKNLIFDVELVTGTHLVGRIDFTNRGDGYVILTRSGETGSGYIGDFITNSAIALISVHEKR